jgi:hypothetical protein
VQAGTSTGRTLQDNCAVRALLPETYPWSSPTPSVATITTTQVARGNTTTGLTSPYCRIVEPFLTSIRGLATYLVPKVDIQLSGTWRSDPGPDLAANYVVTSAVALPSLGRNLSSGNVTVNLIPPATLYAARRNNFDFRVAKIFRYGRTRTQVGVDIYNATNTDAITGFNQNYVANGPWLTPTSIQPARYLRLNAQIDF